MLGRHADTHGWLGNNAVDRTTGLLRWAWSYALKELTPTAVKVRQFSSSNGMERELPVQSELEGTKKKSKKDLCSSKCDDYPRRDNK